MNVHYFFFPWWLLHTDLQFPTVIVLQLWLIIVSFNAKVHAAVIFPRIETYFIIYEAQ